MAAKTKIQDNDYTAALPCVAGDGVPCVEPANQTCVNYSEFSLDASGSDTQKESRQMSKPYLR